MTVIIFSLNVLISQFRKTVKCGEISALGFIRPGLGVGVHIPPLKTEDRAWTNNYIPQIDGMSLWIHAPITDDTNPELNGKSTMVSMVCISY